ncbi:hypothetical protein V1264_001977 [Littorina saxatilis]
MESLWTSPKGNQDSYFNVSLVFRLRTCRPGPQLVSDDEEGRDYTDLSNYVNQAVSWLFAVGEESERVDFFWEERDDCHDVVHTSLGGSASTASVFVLLCGAVIGLLLTFIILFRLWKKKVLRLRDKEIEPAETITKTKEALDGDKQEKQEDVEVENVGGEGLSQTDSLMLKSKEKERLLPKPTLPVIIVQANPPSLGHQGLDPLQFVTKPDSAHFLTYTLEHLSAQLDWMLGLGAPEDPSQSSDSMSPTAASLITPRLQRKGIRRPRWRTLVSLPLGATSLSPDDRNKVRTWQKVEEMERRMKWKQLDVGDLDINAVNDSRLSTVLQFYQQSCPVNADQWSACCLLVNYTLTLLKQELLSDNSDRNPLKILELCSFGSAADGICISRADRFDVMLVVQLPSCSEMSVFHSGMCEDIAGGKLVLGIKESPSPSGRTSWQLLQKDRVGDSFGMFLSHREVVKTVQRSISNALEKLKLKNKSLLDRLPFNLHLNQYEQLTLCLETKTLNGLGLGLSKINIYLTPAVQVTSHDSNPLPALYAVPPWNFRSSDDADASRLRLQARIMRNTNHDVPAGLLWQLNCSELSSSFLASADQKLSSAGVTGCQVMCQQILRALFSRSGKDVLLTMGEIESHVLDSVIFFLLLESPPSSWTLAFLPDRISDCVHFLRSAVQSAWMPGFMVHNPHLLNQMPALKLLPLLTGRQENILANVGPHTADTILNLMDARLQESGLRRCLKEEYSTEMWEYEFFIFG